MYHCHLHINLVGADCPVFDRLRALPALPNFTHTIQEIIQPGPCGSADVIFLDLEGLEPQGALTALTADPGAGPQIIVLATPDQVPALEPFHPVIHDIWVLPMSGGEIDFRLGRWQAACKRERDHWETSQYLEATINSIPNMIWYKNKDGIHEKVNGGFCAIVGKSKDAVQGKDHCFIWDVGPEDAEVCAQTDRKVMSTGETITAEESVLSGNERLLLTTYKSPLYDLDGSVMGTVGVGIDITKERAYQAELMRRNHTMETIFTSLNCGVLCHSLDGSRIISINDAALKILDYASAEEMAQSGFRMVAPSVVDEDKPILRACITGLKNVGDSSDVEYRVLHKDGTLIHVLGNIKLIEENGEVLYQRFLLDVTAQKLQEQETQRRQLALIQALGADYNIVCSFDLKTGRGNPLRLELPPDVAQRLAFAQEPSLTNFTERYIQELVYEPDRDLFRRFASRDWLVQALGEKPVLYTEYRILYDDRIQYYEMKAVRIGVWGERQDMVLGIRSVDDAIQSQIKQRQLLEEALAQANQANKAKSTFLSNMSHDIRTPMNAIVGFTSLAISHLQETGKVAEYLDKIHASSDHLLRLLNDVLDMSAIESGKTQLVEAPCSLPHILDQLHDLVQVSAQSKGLELHFDTAGLTDPDIYCDKLRLDQALINIVTNAIRYTPSGGSVQLLLTQKPDAPAGCGCYVFTVKDTGIGMSPEFLRRVFAPFERERNSTTSGIQGTGLGMAITKNIIEMMNGDIQVDSAQGQGTTVTITLTFRLSQEHQEAPSTHSAGTPSQCGDGRILLVEDNELNKEIAESILQDAGFVTEHAENGQVAVDMFTSHPAGYYKLILMDIQMPVMNGYEATQAIRALPQGDLASIPILAMTANAFEEDRRQALHCGMNGHIAKPIDVNELLRTLDKCLG